MTDHYAVIGNPIAHSFSPQIHSAFAEQASQDLIYEARLSHIDTLGTDLAQWAQEGLKGANITLPFKEAVIPYCQSLSDRAKRSGAVNTLIRQNNSWLGDNTDGLGFICDLKKYCPNLNQKSIFILGAGGSARGIITALIDEGVSPAQLTLCNRSLARIQALTKTLEINDLVPYPWDKPIEKPFDLIINTTSLGHQDQGQAPFPSSIPQPQALAYDLSYGKAHQAFSTWAKQCQIPHIQDGLGMLIEQAAEAFFLWRGIRPETLNIVEQLKNPISRECSCVDPGASRAKG